MDSLTDASERAAHRRLARRVCATVSVPTMRLTLIAAQSVDGFITFHDTPGSAFTSSADKSFFREALKEFDCCIMGSTTYAEAREAIRGNLMQGRLRVVLTRHPDQFAGDVQPGAVEFTDRSPASLVAHIEERGCRKGVLLGGSRVHSLFLEAGLVGELWLTIEPVLFGKGTPLLNAATHTKLELLDVARLAPHTLLLKYAVR